MRELKYSLALQLAYIIMVLGINLIAKFERYIIDFTAPFYILLALAATVGIFFGARYPKSLYSYLSIWVIVYGLVWFLLWRNMFGPITLQVHGIQIILIEISGALSYMSGSHLGEVEALLEGISANTYPSRTLDFNEADNQIRTEMTRSRRYSRPLSVVVFRLDRQIRKTEQWRKFESLERDLIARFTAAKIGQIISEHARQTDLILRDKGERFVVFCPETSREKSFNLADRIHGAIENEVGLNITWGAASFPDESLSFDDLLKKAEDRLSSTELTLPDAQHLEK